MIVGIRDVCVDYSSGQDEDDRHNEKRVLQAIVAQWIFDSRQWLRKHLWACRSAEQSPASSKSPRTVLDLVVLRTDVVTTAAGDNLRCACHY